MQAEDRFDQAIVQIEKLVQDRPRIENHRLIELSNAVKELEDVGVELKARRAELEDTRSKLEVDRRRYLEMFQFAPAGYFLTDMRDVIADVNLVASRILRVEEKRLIGRSILEFVPQVDRKVFRIQLALLHDGQELHGRNTRLLPRDSDPLPVLVDVVPARDKEGAITGFRWLIRDASKPSTQQPQARAERALELLDAAPLGCFVVDHEWRIAFLNRAASMLMRRRPEDVLGKNLWEQFPEAARSRFIDIGHAVMGSREPLEFEEFYEPFKIWIRGIAFPTETGVCVVFQDVTERKKSERAEGSRMQRKLDRELQNGDRLREADRMKDLLLMAASHDLRTPVASILGMAYTLQRIRAFAPDSEAETMLARMVSNSVKLNRLITDLLDLDRISRGLLEPRRVQVDVGSLAARVAREAAAPDRAVRVDAENVTAELDPVLLERIIDNLIGNSVKFSATDVEVSVRLTDEGLLISVEDRGPGVPEELKDEMFEPFKHGSEKLAGSGIGLNIVKEFTELQGGRVWIEDRQGGGSSFRVLFPAAVLTEIA